MLNGSGKILTRRSMEQKACPDGRPSCFPNLSSKPLFLRDHLGAGPLGSEQDPKSEREDNCTDKN